MIAKQQHGSSHRVAVIGAGFSGLGVAEALERMSIDYDQYDRNPEAGGLWFKGVYSGAHLITPKDTTAYHQFPMPASYPDYPARDQVKNYLHRFCSHHGLHKHLHFNAEIRKVEPIDEGERWKLVFESGRERIYDSVVIATGHHWAPFQPVVEGNFSGRQIHSGEYQNEEMFIDKRVLVVGGGNSAADIVVAAAERGKHAHISMRKGHWFLPKILFGKPIGKILRPWLPTWLIRFFLFIAVGDYRDYGLAQPQHRLFSEDPTVNDGLLSGLKHGQIKAYPGIRRLDGKTVEFEDGRRERYDLICWATGFRVTIPCVDDSIIRINNNIPELVAGMYAPYHRNLYVFGVGHLLKPIPRYGVGPMISAGANLLALSIVAQQKIQKPLVKSVSKLVGKPDRYSVGPTYALFMTKVIAWIATKALHRSLPRVRHLVDEKIVTHE